MIFQRGDLVVRVRLCALGSVVCKQLLLLAGVDAVRQIIIFLLLDFFVDVVLRVHMHVQAALDLPHGKLEVLVE